MQTISWPAVGGIFLGKLGSFFVGPPERDSNRTEASFPSNAAPKNSRDVDGWLQKNAAGAATWASPKPAGGAAQTEGGAHSTQRDAFEAAVVAATTQRASEVHQWVSGAAGNLLTSATLGMAGDGCSAWADWLNSDLLPDMVGQVNRVPMGGKIKVESKFGIISQNVFHIDAGPFNHNVVRVQLKDGSKLVLDPWRDPKNPVWDESIYCQRFGRLYEGYGSLAERADRFMVEPRDT